MEWVEVGCCRVGLGGGGGTRCGILQHSGRCWGAYRDYDAHCTVGVVIRFAPKIDFRNPVFVAFSRAPSNTFSSPTSTSRPPLTA